MCDLFKTKQKKRNYAKRKTEKPNTKTICFNFCHCNRTTDNTPHVIPKQQQKAASENWQRCSAPAEAQCAVKFGKQSTYFRPFLSVLKLQTGN